MRPVCLTMSAFGPYAERQIIDFNELKGRSFFLIHGPTGSGKTTILDAMCFALYGDASGTLRDSKTLRSDHAEATVVTEVIFEFAIGEDHYRVKRSPEQPRPKKKGDGMKVATAEAEMWRLLEGEQDELLVTGWSKVTDKVEELLGFKSPQFRQVVLLPQGEFRKLLIANSGERQEIMQTLFKTEVYHQIEEKLKNKAHDFKKIFDEISKEHKWVLQEAGAASVADLEQRFTEQQQQLQEIITEKENLDEKQKKAQEDVTRGRVIQEKFVEKNEAEQKVEEVKQVGVALEGERVTLLRAKQAASLLDMESMIKQLDEDMLAMKKNYAQQLVTLEETKTEQVEVEQQLAIATENESQREELVRDIARLKEIEGKMVSLTVAVEELRGRQAQESRKRETKEALQATLLKIDEEIKLNTVEQRRLLDLVAEIGKRQLDLSELVRVFARRKLLDEAKSKQEETQVELDRAQSAVDHVEQEYSEAKKELLDLQQQWVEGQAAIMAAALAEGAPCPVCGATEHPQLAVHDGALPDENQLKARQSQVDELEKTRDLLRSELTKWQTECKALADKVTDIEQELGEQAQAEIEQLQLDIRAAEARCEEAFDADNQAKVVVEKLVRYETEKNDVTAKIAQAEAVWVQADHALKAAEAIVNERQLAIPSEFPNLTALKKQEKEKETKHKKLKEDLEKAQNKARFVGNALIKCQSALENVMDNLDNARERRKSTQEKFYERLENAGFSDEEDYNSAKKSSSLIEEMEEKVNQFEQDLNESTQRLNRAIEAVGEEALPDIEALNEALVKIQQQYEAASASHTNLTTKIEQAQRWLDKLVKLDADLEQSSANYGLVGRLSEVANGCNEFKLTFQRFVLGALLDDVAEAANERLKLMSRGRYYLQRTMERARKNAAGGLDLEVFDNYTGIARGVGTLSGGETFLASLALALGLADVVQSYAGGIRLDTILVDEGFGTLDPETLDFAMKALIDLQQDGRLVGIISHVPELKERIDARLEVIQVDRGSRAEFKVG